MWILTLVSALLLLPGFSSQRRSSSWPSFEVSEDVLSYPKFQVTPAEDMLLLSESQISERAKQESLVRLYTPAHGEVACFTAKLEPDPVEEARNETESEKPPEDAALLMKRAWKSLEPMKDNCVYLLTGWWSYELCHMSHFRQFHQEGSGAQTEITVEFVLGKFERNTGDGASIVDYGPSKGKFVSAHLGDGTICDLTGRPRQVELQYYCNSGPFPDRIISIRELSTCSYEVVVQTSRLCGLPGFSTKDKKRPKQIQCVNVVSDAFYELELQSRKEKKKQLQLEAENKLKKMKEAMKQQSQNMAPVTDPSKILQDVVQKLMMGGQGDMQPIHIDFIGDDGRILSADVNNKDDIQLKNKNAELEEGDPKDAPSDDKKRRAQEDLKKLLDDFSGFLKPLVNQQNDAEPQKKEPDASSEQQQGPERKSPVSSTEDRGDTEKPKQQDKKEASVNDNVDAVHDEL